MPEISDLLYAKSKGMNSFNILHLVPKPKKKQLFTLWAPIGSYNENLFKEFSNRLDNYIKELFQVPYIDAKVRKQINSFIEKFNYTYSGIRKALIYHYEIKGGDKSKANGGIGIVPYVYQDAYNYHYNLWLAQEKNKNIQVETYAPKIKNITILKPERKVKERKLFTFLDEEE
jgi:hypothetical protein